jgi:hypothetical protein
MTNKKAIEILEDYYSGYFGYKIDDIHEAHNLAIKALEKIDDVKNHKFLSPDDPDYFGKLPEITKGYQKGWNDALDAVMNDFRYEEEENNG